MAVERRLTELAGAGRAASCTPRARATTRWPPTSRSSRARPRWPGPRRPTRSWRALVDAAERHLDWALPGYTHLQRAQPVYLAHHLLAYVWMLARDRERLRFVVDATAALPLGAGALAGVNFATDRGAWSPPSSASRASRRTRSTPSPTATSSSTTSRAAATCATHLSRLGAEIVLWSSEEFGFVELPDAWSSGSSIMPQKKNPDAAELLRAKAPRVVGAPRSALHGVMHALPLTYNKDLQEDKEHLFDAVDTLELCLARGAPGCSRARASTASAWPPRPPTSSSPRPTSPTCSCAAACRSARRTASSPASCARPSSRGRPLAEVAVPALGDEAARGAAPALVAGVQGLRGRDLAGARARAARARPARCSRLTRPAAGLLRPPGARGGAATSSAAPSRHGGTRAA